MLVTADLDNEIAIKTGENIWKEMPFQLCLSPAVISYLFLQNAKLLEGCVCVHIDHPIVLHIPYCPLSLDMIVCSNNNNDDHDLV